MATITAFQDTPNPHALKCVLSTPLAEPAGLSGLRSYTSREAAARDPAATALLGVKGVRGVLIGAGWVTITKDEDASWRSIQPAVEACMRTLA